MFKNLLDKIETHFKKLSPLERTVSFKPNEEENENALIRIENHFKLKLDECLKDLLKKYQGSSFRDDTGFSVPIKIPVLGESKFLEFGIFLTLIDGHYSICDLIEDELFGKKFYLSWKLFPEIIPR